MSDDKKITLYWNIGSQPSRALKALLVAGNVPHNDRHLDMMKGEHKSEEIKKLQPAGWLPFITNEDGMPLYESGALLRYVATKFPSCHKYYPEGFETRAQVDCGLDFTGTFVRPKFIGAFAPIFFGKMQGKEITPEIIAGVKENRGKVKECLGLMETSLKMRGQKYCSGDVISIGDFQCYCQVYDIYYMGIPEILDEFPLCKEWFNLVGSEPGLK